MRLFGKKKPPESSHLIYQLTEGPGTSQGSTVRFGRWKIPTKKPKAEKPLVDPHFHEKIRYVIYIMEMGINQY